MRASKVADRLPAGSEDATTLRAGRRRRFPASRTDTADEPWGGRAAGTLLLEP